MNTDDPAGTSPRIVTRDVWLAARRQLLEQEKALTRQRDALSAARRELPWVKVDKRYVFDTPEGQQTLAQLFEGRSQLIVYHFMWRHDMNDGCVGCSFLADHIDGANQHLMHHDVSFVVVSRAPLATLEAYRKRMGWRFRWASSWKSDFNYDFHVSFTSEQMATGKVAYNFETTDAVLEELPGLSVFFKDSRGDVYHTYSRYGRGNDDLLGAYMYLDLTPKGRNETGPARSMTDWVRHHDRYGAGGSVDATGAYHPDESESARPCCAEGRRG